MAIKLRQKLKKVCKQQDLGNKNFKDISHSIKLLYERVKDKLDQLQDEQIDKMRSDQLVRNGLFNAVANQLDGLVDQLGEEIEEE